MPEEIKTTMGRKVEAGADASQAEETFKSMKDTEDEVGGRTLVRSLVVDPNCGAAVWIIESTNTTNMYRCSNCSGLFLK